MARSRSAASMDYWKQLVKFDPPSGPSFWRELTIATPVGMSAGMVAGAMAQAYGSWTRKYRRMSLSRLGPILSY